MSTIVMKNNNSKTIKVTISISQKLYSDLELQAASLDSTVNTMLKLSAVSALNKTDLNFLTPNKKLAVREFHKNQIRLSQDLQELKVLAKNGKAIPMDQLLAYFKDYHADFLSLINELGDK